MMPSTVIRNMRYDEVGRTLTITFQAGTYRYFEVPPAEWAAFDSTFFKAAYLNEVFKKKGYRYERISLAA